MLALSVGSEKLSMVQHSVGCAPNDQLAGRNKNAAEETSAFSLWRGSELLPLRHITVQYQDISGNMLPKLNIYV